MLLAVGFAVAAWLTAALLSSAAHAAEPPTAEQIAAEVEREVQEDVSTSLPGDPATAEVPPVLDAAALPPEQADPRPSRLPNRQRLPSPRLRLLLLFPTFRLFPARTASRTPLPHRPVHCSARSPTRSARWPVP
ncbi:hypothetical protein ACFSVJ_13535 [Prauserella oleivorans]